MRPNDEKSGRGVVGASGPDNQAYASRAEVEAALRALTAEDHAKLMIIARFFCNQRRLTNTVIEPEELLSEAVLKTFQCEDGKRWSKSVSILKHLDKAMQNISGHLVKERQKIVSFPNGLRPEAEGLASADEDLESEAAQSTGRLKSIFGEDGQSLDVFRMRMEGFQPGEIQAKLMISAKEYETINRRILRKIAAFGIKTKV